MNTYNWCFLDAGVVVKRTKHGITPTAKKTLRTVVPEHFVGDEIPCVLVGGKSVGAKGEDTDQPLVLGHTGFLGRLMDRIEQLVARYRRHAKVPAERKITHTIRWCDPYWYRRETIESSGNLYSDMPPEGRENFRFLLTERNVRVERIVSNGQASPPGFWYDQEYGEWVILLTGEAGLLIEGEATPRVLKAGDWVHLPRACH